MRSREWFVCDLITTVLLTSILLAVLRWIFP
jgi:hypothetical protein